VYIYSTSLGQDKYCFLKKFAEALKLKLGKTIFSFVAAPHNHSVEKLMNFERSANVTIFDDCMLENKSDRKIL